MADMSREETIFGDDWPYSKAKSSLLRSAAIVIREKGPRSATLKNVAGKAGVTEPAIFRHFDGVDGVFQSMFVISELFYDKFVSYFDDRKTAGLDRLGAATDKIFATLRDNADFAYLIRYSASMKNCAPRSPAWTPGSARRWWTASRKPNPRGSSWRRPRQNPSPRP